MKEILENVTVEDWRLVESGSMIIEHVVHNLKNVD